MIHVHGYHAHVYYTAETLEQATALCDLAGESLPVQVGRKHQRPVGPHPMWSCQLAFAPEHLGDVLQWLTLNRQGLTVFIHPETGNDLIDHRDRAIWMGSIEPLKLDIFLSSSREV